MEILGLGYLGLNAHDSDAWVRFAHDVIGLDMGRVPGSPVWQGGDWSGRSDDGSAYFRIDDWTWRLAVHPTPTSARDGLAYLGFELRGPLELKTAVDELNARGYKAWVGSAEDALKRSVTQIAFTNDPAGHVIELFYGPQVAHGYRNSRGWEFLTGPLGMGHVNLFTSDYEKSLSFYTDVLGFKLTDYYNVGDQKTVNFFHVNQRHHTVGLMKVAPFDEIHHLMLEAKSLDMVGMAYDRVKAAGYPITASLGRHSNDQIVSFYVRSPSGVEVELGWGALQLTEDWTPRMRGIGDVWGHHGLTAEEIEKSQKG